MKLVGIGVTSDALAGYTWLPLDDVTALVGANDAGKTTLLAVIHDALAMLQGSPRVATRPLNVGLADLNVELEPRAMTELVTRGCEELAEGTVHHRFELAGEEIVLDSEARLSNGRRIWNSFDRSDDGRDTLLQLIRTQAQLNGKRWDPVFSVLRSSNTVELRPVRSPGADGLNAWAVGWCVPPVSQLAPEVIALIEELGVNIHEGFDAPVPLVPAHPRCIGDENLPLPIWAPLRGHLFPSTYPRVMRELLEGLVDCAQQARDDEREGVPTLPAPTVLMERVLRTLAAMVRAQMPPFVGERYGIFARRTELDDDAVWTLEATSRRSGRSFPLEHLAQGYMLWVQLTLLDALTTAETATGALTRGLSAEDEELDDALLSLLNALGPDWDALHDDGAVASIERIALVWPAKRPLVESGVGETVARFSASRLARLYILDEPEQHLHPALQRRAAQWLRDWSRRRRVQCLIATHEPAFMSLGGGATYSRVMRTPKELVEVEPIAPYALAASDEVAIELGLDRGELLALHRVVLFVEGITDVEVLAHLFPDRVREIGLLICPLHGVKGVRAVPTAQVLFRVLRMPFAVLVDNDPDDRVRDLWKATTDDLRRLAGKDATNEVVHVARMLAAAREESVPVEPMAISGGDILALLDPHDVTAAVAASGAASPATWPGWPQADDLHRRAGRRERFDAFIAAQYGS